VKGAKVVFLRQMPMLRVQPSAQHRARFWSKPQHAIDIGSIRWILWGKLMCIWLKHEESLMDELCLTETDLRFLFSYFTLHLVFNTSPG